MGLLLNPDGKSRSELQPNCANCFGLCCVAHSFASSDRFAYDKPMGEPCRNLLSDFRCGIHRDLLTEGFGGCVAYTCYGAGQKVAQVTFAGQDWRSSPTVRDAMFRTFPMMRQLHEALWLLSEALRTAPAEAPYDELEAALEMTEALTRLGADQLDELSWGEIDAHCQAVQVLVGRAGADLSSRNGATG